LEQAQSDTIDSKHFSVHYCKTFSLLLYFLCASNFHK